MGPFGVPELIIILVIVVIIFGVGKLPEIGSSFGKGIREFKTETGFGSERNGTSRADTTEPLELELPAPPDRDTTVDQPHRERVNVRSDDV